MLEEPWEPEIEGAGAPESVGGATLEVLAKRQTEAAFRAHTGEVVESPFWRKPETAPRCGLGVVSRKWCRDPERSVWRKPKSRQAPARPNRLSGKIRYVDWGRADGV